MMYAVSDALYDELLARLTDALAGRDYFSGSVVCSFGGVECRLTASVIASRRTEHRPEGTQRVLADLVPVWWEFHTCTAGTEVLNDFSFGELRRRL